LYLETATLIPIAGHKYGAKLTNTSKGCAARTGFQEVEYEFVDF